MSTGRKSAWRNLSLLALGIIVGCAGEAQAATDVEAVASVVGTPRLNVPFQIDFGFFDRGNSNSLLNVKVTNMVPAEFTLLSYSPLTGGGAACTNYGHEVVCTFPSTPPGGSGLASVTVLSPVTGIFSNRTAISRVFLDFNRTNDSLSVPITIQQPIARVRGFTVPETNATLPVAEIWLDAPNTAPVTVEFRASEGSAQILRDFQAVMNMVTFPPGVTTQQVSAVIIDNSHDEPDKQFSIILVSAVNADLLPGELTGVVTIADDDPPPPPSADLELIIWEVSGGRLGGEFVLAITVFNGGPEVATQVMLTNRLPAGSTLRFDAAGECLETNGELICSLGAIPPGFGWGFFLSGTAPHAGLYTNFMSVGSEWPDFNQVNNHYAAVFAVAPPLATASVAAPGEFSEGSPSAAFTVALAVPSPDPVSVDYHTLDGTALEGVDFAPTHGTLTFPPGVTNLTVQVPLLEDSLHEAPEQFSLMISNAFGNHLATSPATATIVDNDPPPILSVEDVTVVEGDSEYTEYGLIFTLSTTSAAPVTVTWRTENGTAVTPGDYYSARNTVYFPPGVSRIVDPYVQIRGNTTFEPTETFRIVLGTPEHATLARPEATVTILDDDAVPGRLDHFVITPVLSSPRIANRPFPISVRAVDAFEATVTNFARAVSLILVDSANLPVSTVNPGLLSDFVNGVWTGAVAPVFAPTNASLFIRDGAEHTGLSNPFRVVANPPVRVTVPANTVEGAGTLVGGGMVSIDFAYDEDIVFTLASANTNVARVPASVLLPAGQTNAVFDLLVHDDALLDGTSGANITASAQGFASGSMAVRVHDNETAVLGWSLPATITEGSQNVQITLTVSAPPDANVAVTLSSTAPTRLQMPTAVSFSAGQTSRVFNVNVINDNILQGPQPIEFRAHVENWTDGVASVTLLDNESTNLTVGYRFQGPFFESPAAEGQNTISDGLQVVFGGTLTSNVLVTLTSSDTTEMVVPASVTALAGQSSVIFPITILDDLEFDGSQPVTISASAPGFGPGSRTLTVQDNDVHHLVVGVQGPPTAGYPISGVPFQVSISTRDVNNTNIYAPFNSPLTLTAFGPDGSVSLTPSNLSVSDSRGSWFPRVTAIAWGSNIVLTATATNGVTGQSAPFVIRPPTWSADLRLFRAEIVGNDVRLHLASRPGYTYQVDRTDTLPASAWTSVGPPVTASADLLVIIDFGGATRPGRFYRLTLLP